MRSIPCCAPAAGAPCGSLPSSSLPVPTRQTGGSGPPKPQPPSRGPGAAVAATARRRIASLPSSHPNGGVRRGASWMALHAARGVPRPPLTVPRSSLGLTRLPHPWHGALVRGHPQARAGLASVSRRHSLRAISSHLTFGQSSRWPPTVTRLLERVDGVGRADGRGAGEGL
jgi:hypothetical protein